MQAVLSVGDRGSPEDPSAAVATRERERGEKREKEEKEKEDLIGDMEIPIL